MTQPVETTLNEWNDVKKLEAGNPGLHTKIFFGFLGYLVIPVIIAVLFNKFGLKHWNWLLMGFLTIIDIYVVIKPWPWGGVTILGYILGQVGGKPGLSIQEGLEGSWYLAKKLYRFAVSTILGKQIAFVALAILPINRNEGAVAVILGVILVVILGASLSKSAWVIRTFYALYCLILTGALVYWIAAYNWPELRPSQAKTIAEEADLDMRDQRDDWLTQEVVRIRKEMSKMKASLTPEQRLAKLSPEDRKIWEEAKRGIGGRAISSITEGASAVHKEALDKWGSKDGSPTKTTEPTPQYEKKWSGKFVPNQGELTLGSFDGGLYRVTGSGWRTQVIYKLVDGQYVIEGEYEINKDGVYHNGSTGRGEPPLPFPGQPYGAIIVKVNGKPEWAANESCFSVPQGATLILSLNTKDDQRNRAGSGGFDLRVEKC